MCECGVMVPPSGAPPPRRDFAFPAQAKGEGTGTGARPALVEMAGLPPHLCQCPQAGGIPGRPQCLPPPGKSRDPSVAPGPCGRPSSRGGTPAVLPEASLTLTPCSLGAREMGKGQAGIGGSELLEVAGRGGGTGSPNLLLAGPAHSPGTPATLLSSSVPWSQPDGTSPPPSSFHGPPPESMSVSLITSWGQHARGRLSAPPPATNSKALV